MKQQQQQRENFRLIFIIRLDFFSKTNDGNYQNILFMSIANDNELMMSFEDLLLHNTTIKRLRVAIELQLLFSIYIIMKRERESEEGKEEETKRARAREFLFLLMFDGSK